MTITDWIATSAILLSIFSLWISYKGYSLSKKSIAQEKKFQDWQKQIKERERVDSLKPYFEIKGGHSQNNTLFRRHISNVGAKAKNVGISYGAENNARTKLKDYKFFEFEFVDVFDVTFHDVKSMNELVGHYIEITFENMEGKKYKQLFEYDGLNIVPHDPKEV